VYFYALSGGSFEGIKESQIKARFGFYEKLTSRIKIPGKGFRTLSEQQSAGHIRHLQIEKEFQSMNTLLLAPGPTFKDVIGKIRKYASTFQVPLGDLFLGRIIWSLCLSSGGDFLFIGAYSHANVNCPSTPRLFFDIFFGPLGFGYSGVNSLARSMSLL